MPFRLLVTLGLPMLPCAQEPLKLDTRPINSGGGDPAGITTKDAGYATATEGATDGAKALRLTFCTSYPAVILAFDTPHQEFVDSIRQTDADIYSYRC